MTFPDTFGSLPKVVSVTKKFSTPGNPDPVRGLSEHSLENKGKHSASTSGVCFPAQIAARGGVEIGVFWMLFWDLPPKGGRSATTVVITALPEVLRGDLRWSFSSWVPLPTSHFAT